MVGLGRGPGHVGKRRFSALTPSFNNSIHSSMDPISLSLSIYIYIYVYTNQHLSIYLSYRRIWCRHVPPNFLPASKASFGLRECYPLTAAFSDSRNLRPTPGPKTFFLSDSNERPKVCQPVLVEGLGPHSGYGQQGY